MKDLRQITVIGMGLLGSSLTLAVSRSIRGVKTVGYSHRASTRQKARQLAVADEIAGDLKASVKGSDIVILATPITTFEEIFSEISGSLSEGCLVTDVGSTKALAHQWAQKKLPRTVHYVGSHPIAGSEKRGVEFARDDLFERALCILTKNKKTNPNAARTVKKFWEAIGCNIKVLSPAEHDRIFGMVSHLPHILAAALLNANKSETLKFAGKGFIDTSRIASGPANVWADILVTNSKSCILGIEKIKGELEKIKKTIESNDRRKIEALLDKAREKRTALIKYKMKNKEIL